jgi:uncharacterized protein
MQLDVSQILRNQGEILNFDHEIVLENKEFKSQRIEFKEPVKAKGTVKNVGGVLVLEMEVSGNFSSVCDRCLKEITGKIEFSEEQSFVKSESEEKGEDALVITDKKIDLYDLTVKGVFANLPSKNLCSEDCKGICHKCGADLNLEECKCKDEDDWNPQFEILKGLFS